MGHTGKKKTQTKLLSIKVPAATSAKVIRLAKERHITVSAVVREAIEHFDRAAAVGTFGQRAARYFGVFNGARDLSTNAEHLAGFGAWRR